MVKAGGQETINGRSAVFTLQGVVFQFRSWVDLYICRESGSRQRVEDFGTERSGSSPERALGSLRCEKLIQNYHLRNGLAAQGAKRR
jgi:hypothetical protein